ncbi:MAG: prevent-host-death protein [Herminiimonas sp.]|nr:prevent-host-death protein [Herminiimonas sp.]
MKSSIQVRSISYLKDSIEDVIKTVPEDRTPLIITQNGEEKFVILDMHTFEKI